MCIVLFGFIIYLDGVDDRDSNEPKPRRRCLEKEMLKSVIQRGRRKKPHLLCLDGVKMHDGNPKAETQLVQIADTLNLLCLPFRSRNCWQQQCCQNPKNSDDNQQLDERECAHASSHNDFEHRDARWVSPNRTHHSDGADQPPVCLLSRCPLFGDGAATIAGLGPITPRRRIPPTRRSPARARPSHHSTGSFAALPAPELAKP